jgi:SAM-dependent methyltransferase
LPSSFQEIPEGKIMVFSEYADFYDIYYAEKDYGAEVDFVLELASSFGTRPQNILDMGCGTGGHLIEFVKRGIRCDGFDLSLEMLQKARKRLKGKDVRLIQGNLTDFENGEKYDLVVSMFAVMGYLTDNNQLIAGLETAYKHLKPEGFFIFDGWFGPAVLTQKPERRQHEYKEGANIIVRQVTPSLDPIGQSVKVKYDIIEKKNKKTLKTVKEEHVMRFMFVKEISLAAQIAGLQLVHTCPFMESSGLLSTETWNVTFVAKKAD